MIEMPSDFEPMSSEDLGNWLKEMAEQVATQNHDRTSAIVSGVALEESLRDLVLTYFAKVPEAERTVNNVLGNFNSLINVSYCLGLVSRDEYSDLHAARQIRNYFAHSPKGSTFADARPLELCSQLRIPVQRPELFDKLSCSEKFEATTFVLLENLGTRQWRAREHQCLIPEEIDPSEWDIFFH